MGGAADGAARPAGGSAGVVRGVATEEGGKGGSAAVAAAAVSTVAAAARAAAATETMAAGPAAAGLEGAAAAAPAPATVAKASSVAKVIEVDPGAGGASRCSSGRQGSRECRSRIRRARPGSLRGSMRPSHRSARKPLAFGCMPPSSLFPHASAPVVAVLAAAIAPSSSTDSASSLACRGRIPPGRPGRRLTGSTHHAARNSAGNGQRADRKPPNTALRR